MLKTVSDASLPMVAIRTRDTINFLDVLQHVLQRKDIQEFSMKTPTVTEGSVYYYICPPKQPGVKFGAGFEKLYELLVKKDSTLFFVNPPEVTPLMFDAGELPVPKELVHKFLFEIVDDKDEANHLLLALGGLTIKEVAENIRLCMARDHSLTTAGLVRTRQQYFSPQNGLTFIDPAEALYLPNYELEDWVKVEREFFLGDHDGRLRPRGLLLDGPPGTGKTSGAKYIAREWGVSLFRLDLGATKGKYVGESEAQLIANLNRLDNEAPCVVLLDEIEKMDAGGADRGDTGVGAAMRAQILWWLAEHRSRVLAVMTTNNKSALPPEMYRQGRIDQTFFFGGLEFGAACELAFKTVETFGREPESMKAIADMINGLLATKPLLYNGIASDPPTLAHSTVVTETYEAIKRKLF
jgi:hypothetical protein